MSSSGDDPLNTHIKAARLYLHLGSLDTPARLRVLACHISMEECPKSDSYPTQHAAAFVDTARQAVSGTVISKFVPLVPLSSFAMESLNGINGGAEFSCRPLELGNIWPTMVLHKETFPTSIRLQVLFRSYHQDVA